MVISGAGGHALEVFDEWNQLHYSDSFHFFDEINKEDHPFQKRFQILHFEYELEQVFAANNKFSLGVGAPHQRKYFLDLMTKLGGKYCPLHAASSQISPFAKGEFDTLAFSFVGHDCQIGLGTLVNTRANVHHECEIGEFVEIGPGSLILGQVQIGDYTRVGAGAVILPGVKVGDCAVIGAGAVVTKDVPSGQTVKGVPAK